MDYRARILLKSVAALALAGALYLSFRGVSLAELLPALRRFSPGLLVLVALMHSLPVLFSFIRIALLLGQKYTIPLAQVARAIGTGHLVNTFAPARAGDVVNCALLVRASKGKLTPLAAAGVLLADKLLDLAALATVLVPLLSVVFLGIFAALGKYSSPKRLILCFALGTVAWTGEMYAIRALAAAQGFPLAWSATAFALTTLHLGILFPVAPMNIGAFEAGLAFGLSHGGVPMPNAIVIAAIYHVMQCSGILLFWIGAEAANRIKAREPAAATRSLPQIAS